MIQLVLNHDPASSFFFEYDIRTNASGLFRGKTGFTFPDRAPGAGECGSYFSTAVRLQTGLASMEF
jgi:hypothetical protein